MLEVIGEVGDAYGSVGNGTLIGFVAGVVCNLAYDAFGCAKLTAPMGVKVCIDVLDGMSAFP